jgi:hypothetical protein
MKKLVIGDIHNKIIEVKNILNTYESEVDQVIFLGDYFDDHGNSNPDDTVKWLKESIYKENRIHLIGNHDVQYFFPQYAKYCSGYNGYTQLVIDEFFSGSEIRLYFSLYFKDKYFWYSHAGFHPYWIEHPVMGIDFKDIEYRIMPKEEEKLHSNQLGNLVKAVGKSRSGLDAYGGILWLDFNCEFTPIENMNQIVGHTRHEYVEFKNGHNSINIDIDCGLKQVLIVEEDNFKILETVNI